MAKKETILKELNYLSKKNGGMLMPPEVVEYAKNKSTALHSCFTWDDTRAAQQWRFHQARMLIRVMVMVLPNDDGTEFRAFVSLKDDRYSHLGYRAMVSILQDEDLTAQMLEEALEEAAIWREKYKELKQLVGIFEEMDKVIVRRKIPIRQLVLRKDSRIAARA